MMCRDRGLTAVGRLSSASDKATSRPVFRFFTLICFRISCEENNFKKRFKNGVKIGAAFLCKIFVVLSNSKYSSQSWL